MSETRRERPDAIGEARDPTLSYIAPRDNGEAETEAIPLTIWTVTAEHGVDAGPRTLPPPPTEATEREFPVPGETETYRLERIVGRGGCGEVWSAVQVSLGRRVAVKMIRRDHHSSRELSERQRRQLEREFRQEALTTANLEHPNIVPVHDLGADSAGRPMLAMKLVDGTPWHRALHDDFEALPPAALLAKHLPILCDVSQAVAFAHSRGIVHRDLKPSQVMLGSFGEVVLMDWGLATIFDAERCGIVAPARRPTLNAETDLPLKAHASNPSGTPVYMAPEQTDDTTERIGPWTDVYLLGATLYLLLTGTPPHDAPNATAAFLKAREGVVEPPERRAPEREVPPELSSLCAKAMAKAPRERLQSAREFLEAVQAYLSGETKRRESLAITGDVARRLEAASDSYAGLTECANSLGRARGLWEGNAALANLEDAVAERFTRAALRNGDLVLAHVQAERLSQPAHRAALLHEVEEAERTAARHRRQRRHAMLAVGVLLLAHLVGMTMYFRQQKESSARIAFERDQALAARNAAERARAEESTAREAAETSRKETQELLQYMLTDLRDKLVPMGRVSILKEVAERAVDLYERTDPGRLPPPERLRMAEALTQLGLTATIMGDHTKGAPLFARAAAIAEAAAPLQADAAVTSNALRHAIQARIYGTDSQILTPELPKAIATLLEERQRLIAIDGEVPTTTASLALRAVAELKLAGAFIRAFDLEKVRTHSQSAVDNAERYLALDPKTWRVAEIYAAGLRSLGDSYLFAYDLASALGFYERMAAFVEELRRKYPDNLDLLRSLSLAYERIGAVRQFSDAWPEAHEAYSKAMEVDLLFHKREPGNAEARRSVMVGWNHLGDSHAALARPEESLAAYEESLRLNREILLLEPEQLDLRRGIVPRAALVANARMALLRYEGVPELLEEAFRILEALPDSQLANPGHFPSEVELLGKALMNTVVFDRAAILSHAPRYETLLRRGGPANEGSAEVAKGELQLLIGVANAKFMAGNFEEARNTAATAIARAERIPNPPADMQALLASPHRQIAQCSYMLGELPAAIDSAERSIALVRALDESYRLALDDSETTAALPFWVESSFMTYGFLLDESGTDADEAASIRRILRRRLLPIASQQASGDLLGVRATTLLLLGDREEAERMRERARATGTMSPFIDFVFERRAR